jgi:hypothetical protein
LFGGNEDGRGGTPGTGSAFGAVEGVATSAIFCASATSSAVLNAEVGVGVGGDGGGGTFR